MKLYACDSIEEYKILVKAYQISGNTITLFDQDHKYLSSGIVTFITEQAFIIREAYNTKVKVYFQDILECKHFIG
ncbi:hypothetical protein [Fusibacter sp. 3D3]|uniref:hypothetical protein n=1 Tax=Fusibacter sp. 3D3 TaxID=1048380 RepID=UPI0008538898|nr:hypothetical protein [Fusibacter sp. 3D3]GAU79488.1 hypothetical protein F3D3_4152 [Fusibacter sp. 3D3]